MSVGSLVGEVPYVGVCVRSERHSVDWSDVFSKGKARASQQEIWWHECV